MTLINPSTFLFAGKICYLTLKIAIITSHILKAQYFTSCCNIINIHLDIALINNSVINRTEAN